jgi:hypothetical protein
MPTSNFNNKFFLYNTNNNNMQTAQTIMNQLGGNKFIAMTGSKNFFAIENGLQMNLSKNKVSAQYLKIELTSTDFYKMTFYSFRGAEMKIKNKVEGVYFDQLQDIFTNVTGHYTSISKYQVTNF